MTGSSGLPRRQLGRSGIEVSVVGLGGNTFGPPRLDEAETTRVIAAALDLGVNFVDTAIVYGSGASEVLIGRALGRRRDEMVIATKCNFFGPSDLPGAERIRQQAEESLSKLGTDRIDLLQIHFPADDVPAEEILNGLDRLVREGKVRAIGACNYAGWRLAESAVLARELGTETFVSVQNYHHLLARPSAAEVLPFCRRHGLGFLPYHPLAGGFLTGKYRRGEPPPEGTRGAAGSPIVTAMSTESSWDALDRLEAFAREHERTVGELAIAWLLSTDVISSVIAGVSNPDQLAANVAAAGWQLEEDDVRAVDAIVGGAWDDPERPPYA